MLEHFTARYLPILMQRNRIDAAREKEIQAQVDLCYEQFSVDAAAGCVQAIYAQAPPMDPTVFMVPAVWLGALIGVVLYHVGAFNPVRRWWRARRQA